MSADVGRCAELVHAGLCQLDKHAVRPRKGAAPPPTHTHTCHNLAPRDGVDSEIACVLVGTHKAAVAARLGSEREVSKDLAVSAKLAGTEKAKPAMTPRRKGTCTGAVLSGIDSSRLNSLKNSNHPVVAAFTGNNH